MQIGLSDLIERRRGMSVPLPDGGQLHDYVPFYFTPRSTMAFCIATGRGVQRRSAAAPRSW